MPPKSIPITIQKDPSYNYIPWILILLVVLGLGFFTLFIIQDRRDTNDESITTYYKEQEKNIDDDKICIKADTYHELLAASQRVCERPKSPPLTQVHAQQIHPQQALQPIQSTDLRDRRVLYDPLYPPLNRTDAVNYQNMQMNINTRNMYVPTNDIGDSFRVVGYLVNNDPMQRDMGGNSWKLFARQKDRNTSEFYMIPSNNNYDIKVFLKDDMVVGTRLRDVYSIPNEIEFNTPMLNKSPYQFIELPKTDYSSSVRFT